MKCYLKHLSDVLAGISWVLLLLIVTCSPVFAQVRIKPNRFPIGFWSTGMPLPSSTAMLDDWDEAGFSMIYGGHWTYAPGIKNLMQWLLFQGEMRNFQVIIEDTRIDAPGVGESIPADYAQRVRQVIEDYGHYSALFGFKIDDESDARVFENTYACADIAREGAPTHQIIINMFPWYNWTGAYYQYSNFQDFMTDLTNLHADSEMEVFSADCYFQLDTVVPPENGTWDTFFPSMYRYGQWCRQNQRDLWHIVLAIPHTAYQADGITPRFNYEIPNEAVIRWQFNCSIAYGARGVFYYTFYTPNLPEFGEGAIDLNGDRTEIFYWLKDTHSDFRQTYGDMFLELELTKVMQAGQQFGSVPAFAPDELITGVNVSGGISNYPLIISRFADPAGGEYVMLVNNTYDPCETVLTELVLADPNLYVFRYESGGVVEVDDVQRFPDYCKVLSNLQAGREVLYRIEYAADNCGEPGTVYPFGDIDKDCDVDLNDLHEFGVAWLFCSNPQDSSCQSEELVLYDDFSVPSASATKWTVFDTPSTPVTFDGSKAILNLQEPPGSERYEVRIVANSSLPVLSEVGDSFRITWDMQRNPSVSDVNGWVNGICIGNDERHSWYGGQYGLMDSLADSRVGSLGMNNEWGYSNAGTNWYHHDAYMSVRKVDYGCAYLHTEYRAYVHNPAYNSDPGLYVVNETPVKEVVDEPDYFRVNIDEPLSVRFYMNDTFGDDGAGHSRGEIFVDNVFSIMNSAFLEQDIDKNGKIDLSDFGRLSQNWLTVTLPMPLTLPVTDGLSLWLKADAGVTLDGSYGVSYWADQLVGDNLIADDVTQPIESKRPTLVYDKWHSLAVIEFSRSNSSFLSNDSHSIELQFSQYEPKTVFIVGKKDQTVSGYMTYLSIQHSSNLPCLQINGPGVAGTLLMGHRDTDGSNGDTIVSSIPHPLKYSNDIPLVAELQDKPISGVPNVRRIYDYIDGRAGDNYLGLPGFNVTDDWLGRLLEGTYIGAGNGGTVNFLEGSIAEIIVYRRDLTLAERNAVGVYLQQKWDIQNSDYEN